MYDEAYLRTWQPKFASGLEDNWNNVILPRLTPREYNRLKTVRIDVPLSVREWQPLMFSISHSGTNTTIVMPAASLRFLGDLLLAYAWLDEHGHDLRPAFNYVSMLKYEAMGLRVDKRVLSPPLEALGIAESARAEPRTMGVFQKLTNTAFLFILLHELGHAYHRDTYSGQQAEVMADRFAIVFWNRLGEIPPLGAVLFFAAAAQWEKHRADFESEREWEGYLAGQSHPLTADRMEALASGMREERVEGAADIEQIARRLRDPGFLNGMSCLGRTLPLEYLRKR